MKVKKFCRKTDLIMSMFFILVISCGTLVGNPEEDEPQQRSKYTVESVPESFEKQIVVEEGQTYVAPESGVQFFLTDSPVDEAESVLVTISELAISKNGSKWIKIPLEISETIDLITLKDGNSMILGKLEELEPGYYTETRLTLTDKDNSKLILKDGSEHDLKIPSGQAAGIKLKTEFEVVEGEAVRLTIDFDLRKSITVSNGDKYSFKPTLRFVRNHESGSIAGNLPENKLACLYLDGEEMDETVECANAVTAAKSSKDKFKLSFVPAGTYVLRIFAEDGSYSDLEGIVVEEGKSKHLTINEGT